MRTAQIAVEAVNAATVTEVAATTSPLAGPPGDLGVLPTDVGDGASGSGQG
jgi:hypothetical protein